MSTATEKRLSLFDAWVLREAKRIERDYEDDIEALTGGSLSVPSLLLENFGPSSDPPPDFDAMLARFREHSEARKAFAEEEKHHCAEAFALEQRLVEQFTLGGTQSIKRDGKTFFLQRERSITALPESRQQLVEVMRELGHDEMIVVQPQRLASWGREMLDDEATGGNLPEEVLPLVKVHEAMRLRMRAG